MEAILLTKKMAVEAGLASSEDGGRIKKDEEVQEVQGEGGVQEEMEKVVQMADLVAAEVQIRIFEVSRSNNSKIQTSMMSKQYFFNR